MKKSELFLTFLKVPIDYAMIFFAGLTAYFIRFESSFTTIRPVIFELSLHDFLRMDLIMALLWLVIFVIAGLYRIESRPLGEVVSRVFMATGTGTLGIIVTIFFQREIFSSRFLILAIWFLSFAYVSCARFLLFLLQRVFYRFGIGVHNVALIGSGHFKELFGNALSNPIHGYRIMADYENVDDDALEKIKSQHELDEIIVASDKLSVEDVSTLLNFAWEHGLEFKYAANLVEASMGNPTIYTLAGVPLVSLEKTPLEGWGRILKRMTDIIGAIMGLIMFGPLMIVCALMIKLTSKGPVFFHLDDGTWPKRVGQNGRAFVFLKFRTMRFGTHKMKFNELQGLNIRQGTPMTKIPNDPRITGVGKFLRRYSLDELPQFINAFMGNMSIVGPRPHEIEEVARYAKHHKWVLSVKPGITGLAQVSGRSDLNFEDEVRLDTYYVRNWSWFMDLKIMLKTPVAVFAERKAE